MKKLIYKFPLHFNFDGVCDLVLTPCSKTILTIGVQGDRYVLWAEQYVPEQGEPEPEKAPYRVTVVGTGHEVPTEGEYLTTIHTQQIFVWHFYGEWVRL